MRSVSGEESCATADHWIQKNGKADKLDLGLPSNHKEVAMRKLSVIILSSAVLIWLAAGPVYGQWTTLKSEIPFDFSVGSRNLPADTYTVNKADSPAGALVVRSHGDGAFCSAHPSNSSMAETNARLVFRKYGDQYFLAEVWGISNMSFEVPKSAKERQVSLNQPEPRRIYVAAK
jgi:hypothetical protein